MIAAALLAFSCLHFPGVAHAETYNTCTGFITSVPVVISTQGTWCMKQDLATAMTSGAAITIATNNVTIDCNNFKLGGLAAGLATATEGVFAYDRVNATIRHCKIRGFRIGIDLTGSTSTSSSSHLIEDNRFDGNTYGAIYVRGDGSLVQRNRIFDTGGGTIGAANTTPLWTLDSVDVIDNTVANSVAAGTNTNAFGIYSSQNPSGRIIGNAVRGVLPTGTGSGFALYLAGNGHISVRDNDLSGDLSANSTGMICSTTDARAKNNIINGFSSSMSGCGDAGGNDISP
jgi:parallel beta-helix repeat protein